MQPPVASATGTIHNRVAGLPNIASAINYETILGMAEIVPGNNAGRHTPTAG